MTDTSFGAILVSFMFDVVVLAGVPLAVATLLGFIISFFQAVTQIQDQSLSQTAKIAAIAITLFAFGAALATPLMNSTVDIFDNFSQIAR